MNYTGTTGIELGSSSLPVSVFTIALPLPSPMGHIRQAQFGRSLTIGCGNWCVNEEVIEN